MGWEPPEPRRLLVSSSRVAQELDIPAWKAQEVCRALERVYYAPAGTHYRVTRRSLDAFKELLEQGLPLSLARSVMWRYAIAGELPSSEKTYRELMLQAAENEGLDPFERAVQYRMAVTGQTRKSAAHWSRRLGEYKQFLPRAEAPVLSRRSSRHWNH